MFNIMNDLVARDTGLRSTHCPIRGPITLSTCNTGKCNYLLVFRPFEAIVICENDSLTCACNKHPQHKCKFFNVLTSVRDHICCLVTARGGNSKKSDIRASISTESSVYTMLLTLIICHITAKCLSAK